jgi:malonyl-CoA O-methyltransferase
MALAHQWARRTHSVELPFLIQEVQARMLERAALIRLAPGVVVDQSFSIPGQSLAPTQLLLAGASPATDKIQVCQICPALTHSEPSSLVKPASLASAIKAKLSGLLGQHERIQSTTHRLLPTERALPQTDGSVSLVWSTLWLHRDSDPRALIEEWARVLKPGGALFFSCFGPDTARELMNALVAIGQPAPDYVDMHDIGDMLVRAGLSDPVMEMEKLTLTYASPKALLDDWRATESNNLVERHRGLRGRAYLASLEAALERQRDPVTGRIPLTLELVYGHAWRVAKKPPTDVVISVDSIGGRRKKSE